MSYYGIRPMIIRVAICRHHRERPKERRVSISRRRAATADEFELIAPTLHDTYDYVAQSPVEAGATRHDTFSPFPPMMSAITSIFRLSTAPHTAGESRAISPGS